MSDSGSTEESSVPPEWEDCVRGYYRSLDDHDYERLAELLTTSFVHDRPERTLSGRDRFVEFMRNERPLTDTTHPLDGLYSAVGGDAVAARGRLVTLDGSVITGFVDVFSFTDGRISRIETYVSE